MISREIDIEAIRVPQRAGLLPCLYVPIAARDENAIQKYVGKITKVLSKNTPNKALLVQSYDPPERDMRLPIWQLKESNNLHYPHQVWVHVNYTGYRKAYMRAFPEESLKDIILDHVLNRKVARITGFTYLRIVPISGAANTSSGASSEIWAVEYHSTPYMIKFNKESKASIRYADLADIVKMLDLKTGGSIQEGVNDAQVLVDLPINQ